MQPLRTGDPRRLGDYELSGRLGEGGQGVVYLGTRSPERGEHEPQAGAHHEVSCAVKLLHGTVGDEQAAFLREVELAKHVARFCTAQVLDVGFAEGRPFIVSEYVDGPSLHREVALTGPRRGASLERLAVGCATALAAIHRAGIVHRDFKPQNVLLGPDGPRVIDFGLARALDAAATQSGRGVGTPAYMAPEQITASAVTGVADVFAWGATMCFAANASAPFGQDSVAPVLHRILTAPPALGRLEGALRELVAACLEKDPRNRPTSRDLLLELLGGAEGVPAEVLRSPPPHVFRAARAADAADAEDTDPTGWMAAGVSIGGAPIAEPEATGAAPDSYRLPDAESAGREKTGTGGLGSSLVTSPRAGAVNRAGLAVSGALLVTAAILVAVVWPGISRRDDPPPQAAAGPTVVVTTTPLALHPQLESENSLEKRSEAPPDKPAERPTDRPPPATQVPVPAVVGMDRAAAQKALKAGGLVLGDVAEVDSPRKIGQVLSSVPAAGARVAPGSRVSLTLSAGITVPKVVGLTRPAAVSALTASGLAVGKVTLTCAAGGGNRVTAASPAQGSRAPAGTKVALTVARNGAQMPGVVGSQRAQATKQLAGAGFTVRVVPRLVSDPSQGDVVLAQNVAAGTCAKPGRVVTLTVGVMGQTEPEPDPSEDPTTPAPSPSP
ncbi:PASTA domain-containing protein [Nonomuraea soli]|nr:PASTA domain-containing protein [Nonomuraea soli]